MLASGYMRCECTRRGVQRGASMQVPNMFPYDERAALLEQCRAASRAEGLALESPTDLWGYFVDKTKANLHVVLCFSPIGDAFRCAGSHVAGWTGTACRGAVRMGVEACVGAQRQRCARCS